MRESNADETGAEQSRPNQTPPPDRPNLAYYQACQGAWQSRLSYWLLFLPWPRWLGLTMETTVDAGATDEVLHTTTIRWFTIPFCRTSEVIALDDNGRDFTIEGHMTWPVRWRRVMVGMGQIDESGTRSTYSFRRSFLFGFAKVRQTGEVDGDLVTIHQRTWLLRGVQQLRRLPSQRTNEAPTTTDR